MPNDWEFFTSIFSVGALSERVGRSSVRVSVTFLMQGNHKIVAKYPRIGCGLLLLPPQKYTSSGKEAFKLMPVIYFLGSEVLNGEDIPLRSMPGLLNRVIKDSTLARRVLFYDNVRWEILNFYIYKSAGGG
jgi:hypothetical protein